MLAKEPIKPRLLSVKEAASYPGRSVPSIRELIWAGSLPIIRVGRRIHVDILDLEKWIEQHKIRYTY
jgi:excisionase family DNA binding protein